MKTVLLLAALAVGCTLDAQADGGPSPTATTDGLAASDDSTLVELLGQYTTVRLDADLSGLSDSTRAMLPHLIAAARIMDEVYWTEANTVPRDSLLAGLSEPARRYVAINAGPWDRLDGNTAFLPGVGPKPLGAGFYPADLTKEELLQQADLYPERDLTGLYTLVRREGRQLVSVPYHQAFADAHGRAAAHLRAAADLAQDPGLERYLRLRADALLTDDYRASDLAWMDMRSNPLDVVIGPIETYEDQLAGFKASHEAFVLVKDQTWSDRLAGYARLLPQLQAGLPVPDAYKAETPGTDADLGAYDVVFVAGDANVGSKTIAINLPNDETVQLEKGSRRLQLKNAMRAKFDRILVPIAGVLLPEDQRDLVTFPAFFGNTMFHEVAHGLGIKETITGNGTVREALQDRASALEEGQGGRAGALHGPAADRARRVGRGDPRRAPGHVRGVHLPVDPVRGVERARPRQLGPLQLFPGAGRHRPRGDARRRGLARGPGPDDAGRPSPRGANPDVAGRRRLRRGRRLRQAVRPDDAGAHRQPGPRRGGRHPRRRGLTSRARRCWAWRPPPRWRPRRSGGSARERGLDRHSLQPPSA